MPSCHYDADAFDKRADDDFSSYRQDLLDAKADGYEAGLKGQRIEMNPYLPIEPEYTQWIDGWREGLWIFTKRNV